MPCGITACHQFRCLVSNFPAYDDANIAERHADMGMQCRRKQGCRETKK